MAPGMTIMIRVVRGIDHTIKKQAVRKIACSRRRIIGSRSRPWKALGALLTTL